MADEQATYPPLPERHASESGDRDGGLPAPRTPATSEEWLERQHGIALAWERQSARRDLWTRILVVFAALAALAGVCMLALPTGQRVPSRPGEGGAGPYTAPQAIQPAPASRIVAPPAGGAPSIDSRPAPTARPASPPLPAPAARRAEPPSAPARARAAAPRPRPQRVRRRPPARPAREPARPAREPATRPSASDFDRGVAGILDRLE